MDTDLDILNKYSNTLNFINNINKDINKDIQYSDLESKKEIRNYHYNIINKINKTNKIINTKLTIDENYDLKILKYKIILKNKLLLKYFINFSNKFNLNQFSSYKKINKLFNFNLDENNGTIEIPNEIIEYFEFINKFFQQGINKILLIDEIKENDNFDIIEIY